MNKHFETESVLTFTLMPLVAILLLIVWSLILAWPFQLLWNRLVPSIFGFNKITFFQAFGLKLMLGLVFGRVSLMKRVKDKQVFIMIEIEKKGNQTIDNLVEHLKPLVEQMKQIHEMAVVAYTPLVDDLCSRKATQNEVEWMLDGRRVTLKSGTSHQ